jgi:N-methylhydantoinase A
MRYEGQAFDLEVALSDIEFGNVEDAKSKFHQQYEAVFGISLPEAAVMFVNLRTTIVGISKKINTVDIPLPIGRDDIEETRLIVFDGNEQLAKVMGRNRLSTEIGISGPVIIEEYDTTVFVPSGYSIYRDTNGNIIGEAES